MLQSVPNPKTANGFHSSNFSRCVNFPFNFCLKLILVMLVSGNTLRLELGVNLSTSLSLADKDKQIRGGLDTVKKMPFPCEIQYV